MSTGFECLFVEWNKNEWYYILQNWNCPVGAWDWREYATAYGPFKSEEKADKHLRDNHANPGGSSQVDANHDDPVMIELIAEAKEMQKSEKSFASSYRIASFGN